MTLSQISKAQCEEFKKIRTNAISEMFDSPDESGIYRTTKFFNTIDEALRSSHVAIIEGIIVGLEKDAREELAAKPSGDIEENCEWYKVTYISNKITYLKEELEKIKNV